ncbi:hypothetical protein V8E52_007067 [Russula decolorans]
MQAFVACLAAAAVFFICCIVSCLSPDEDVRRHSRPYRASSSRNAHTSYPRGSNARTKKSAVKTPAILEHSRDLSRLNRISPPPDAEQSSAKVLSNLLLSDEGKDVTAEDLRKVAQGLQRERHEALKLANHARKKGDYDAAARYKQDVQKCKSGVEFLNKVAADVIFTKKNKGRPDGMIDLHGLYVGEALEYAELAFELAALEDDKVARFIVGKGLHAKDGKAKIRPALEKLCQERGFTYYLDPKNAGVLIVHC